MHSSPRARLPILWFVSVRIPSLTPAQQAEAIVNANYERLKTDILRAVAGKLRAEGVGTMARADLEEAYNLGWHHLCQWIIREKPVTSLEGLLFRMTHRRALDIYRQRHERLYVDTEVAEQGVDGALEERVDDTRTIANLLRLLRNRLNDNERRGVALCLVHGYTRPEAGEMLGIDRAAFERVMDSATKKLGLIAATIRSRGCGPGEWSRLMQRYAMGMLEDDHPDYERAANHIEGAQPCGACLRYVRSLQGLAGILPPLGLPFAPLGAHEPGIVAHLAQRLFGSGHSATASTASTSVSAGAGTATVAGGGSAATTGLLSAGAMKTAAIAGIAAIGALSTAVVVTHRHPPKTTRSAHTAALTSGEERLLAPISASISAEQRSGRHTSTASGQSSDRRAGARTTESEFAGFEGGPRKPSPNAQVAVPASVHREPTTATAASTAEGSPSTGEFGFERAQRKRAG